MNVCAVLFVSLAAFLELVAWAICPRGTRLRTLTKKQLQDERYIVAGTTMFGVALFLLGLASMHDPANARKTFAVGALVLAAVLAKLSWNDLRARQDWTVPTELAIALSIMAGILLAT